MALFLAGTCVDVISIDKAMEPNSGSGFEQEHELLNDVSKDLKIILQTVQSKILDAHLLYVELATAADPQIFLNMNEAFGECRKCSIENTAHSEV